MLRVGLTGGIGSGKSTVARLFHVLGAPVFDADAQAKALMANDPVVREAVKARFGAGLFAKGELDRAFLASKGFGNKEELEALNAIVHPAVRGAFTTWVKDQTAPYVIMEAAIMAENEGYRAFDRVINVSCPEELRIQRVIQRDGTTREAVLSRMAHQATEEDRSRIAQFTVRNDGSELVIPQVLLIHAELTKLAAA